MSAAGIGSGASRFGGNSAEAAEPPWCSQTRSLFPRRQKLDDIRVDTPIGRAAAEGDDRRLLGSEAIGTERDERFQWRRDALVDGDLLRPIGGLDRHRRIGRAVF